MRVINNTEYTYVFYFAKFIGVHRGIHTSNPKYLIVTAIAVQVKNIFHVVNQ